MNLSPDQQMPIQLSLSENSLGTMSFNVQYEAADYLQAQVLYFPQTLLSWPKRLTAALLASAAFVIVAGRTLGGMSVVALFALSILISFLIDRMRFVVCRWRLWYFSHLTPEWWIKLYRKSVNDVPQVATVTKAICNIDEAIHEIESPSCDEFQFDDWGGHHTTNKAQTSRAWPEYQQVLENEQVFLLVYGRRSYWIIPKRALTSVGGPNVFREILQRRIKGRS